MSLNWAYNVANLLRSREGSLGKKKLEVDSPTDKRHKGKSSHILEVDLLLMLTFLLLSGTKISQENDLIFETEVLVQPQMIKSFCIPALSVDVKHL